MGANLTKTRLSIVPKQRAVGDQSCGRCGAKGGQLDPDDAIDGGLRCSINDVRAYMACEAKWEPHCPIWCSGHHDRKFEYREGKWFHHTRALDITVSCTSSKGKLDVESLELCVFESITGEFEEPIIHLGDTGMRADEARAFAAAFITIANLADLTAKLTKQT